MLVLFSISLLGHIEAQVPLPIYRHGLQAELQLAQPDPDRYYLRVDLFANTLELKAGGRVLLDVPIESAHVRAADSAVAVLDCVAVIPPHIPLPAFQGNRLGGRRLPLDFVGRLIEGPRKRDRIYFGPALMIVSSRSPSPSGVTYIEVSGEDMKSLSSAVEVGTRAVLIRQPVPSP